MTCIKCQLLQQKIVALENKLKQFTPTKDQLEIIRKHYALSGSEGAALLMLYNAPQSVLSKNILDEGAVHYSNVSRFQANIEARVDVVITRIRAKLKKQGIQNSIGNVRSKGYYITKEGYNNINNILKDNL